MPHSALTGEGRTLLWRMLGWFWRRDDRRFKLIRQSRQAHSHFGFQPPELVTPLLAAEVALIHNLNRH